MVLLSGKFAQLTADLISFGMTGKMCMQGLNRPEYRIHDSIPEEVLKPAAEANGSHGLCPPFREEFAGYGLDISAEATPKPKPDIQLVDLVTLPGRDFTECQLWGAGLRGLLTRHQPILTTTQWCMCMCFSEELACEPGHFTVQHLKQEDTHRRKGSDWAPQIVRREEERCLERTGRARDKKKQVEKEGVSYEPGGFSTRFVFFFSVALHCVATWVLWSCVFFFFSSSSAPKTLPYTVNPEYFVRTQFSYPGLSNLSYAWNFRTVAGRCRFSDLHFNFRMHFIFVRKQPRTKYTKITCIRNILDLQYLLEGRNRDHPQHVYISRKSEVFVQW